LCIIAHIQHNKYQPIIHNPLKEGELSMSRFISTALCALFVCSVCSSVASAADLAAGKATYEASCVTCHKTGLMGAPKLGDKVDWAPRIKQGVAVLASHAEKGFKGAKGTMPAKGGNAKLTTAEIGNAVAYMVKSAK
jgi:cytochrome c5